jgi:hypothetical protein
MAVNPAARLMAASAFQDFLAVFDELARAFSSAFSSRDKRTSGPRCSTR